MNTFEFKFLGINKSFGSRAVIRDARLKVTNAQCTLLIGENGSAKSTLIKIISGLAGPDSGQIRINTIEYKWGQGKSLLLKNSMYLNQHPYLKANRA